MPTRYAATRLAFNRDVIEPLGLSEAFEVETPEGVFRLTKSQFYEAFPGVVASVSYRERGLYYYARTPVRARAFLESPAGTPADHRAAIVAPLLDGQEPLHRDAEPLDRTVRDFWRWAHSDLLSNALRGCLAEYLVAVALRVDDKPRREWTAWDLTSASGLRIEVKSSAYVQSWYQKAPSTISFGVGESVGWDPDSNHSGSERKRHADVYVFALLVQTDRQFVDPLDVEHWRFILVVCADLNRLCGKQEKISLARLRSLPHIEVSFDDLAEGIERTAARSPQSSRLTGDVSSREA